MRTWIGVFCIAVFYATTSLAQPLNRLTAEEKAAGWTLLFNGQDFGGWHVYGNKKVGTSWKIEEGAMKLDVPERWGNKAKDGGDLVTDATFTGNFELKLDWKVSRQANSGVFFFVKEAPEFKQIFDSGLELQVLDDAIYGDAPENKHRAGDFFGVANARIREPNPVGAWNSVVVRLQNNQLTVTMNGFLIQEHNLNGADWKSRIGESALKKAPVGQGTYSGRIGLQDWGSTVWYRNLKVRKL